MRSISSRLASIIYDWKIFFFLLTAWRYSMSVIAFIEFHFKFRLDMCMCVAYPELHRIKIHQSVKQYKIHRCIEFKLKRFFPQIYWFSNHWHFRTIIGYASISLCPIFLWWYTIIQCLSVYICWWCLEFIHWMEAYNIFCLWSSDHKSECNICINFFVLLFFTLFDIHTHTHKGINAFIVVSIIIKVLMMFHYSLFGALYSIRNSLWHYLALLCLACTSLRTGLFKI